MHLSLSLLSLLPLCILAEPGLAPVCLSSGGTACGSSLRKAASSQPPPQCELYLAESAVEPGKIGLFTGVKKSSGDRFTEPEPVVPILDGRNNEWSPWHDMVSDADLIPQALLESHYLNSLFVPGVATMATCSDKYNNIDGDSIGSEIDASGVHRYKDPTAGAFTYYHNQGYEVTQDLMAGEELTLPCTESGADRPLMKSHRKVLSPDFLEENAVCLDNLSVGESTLPDVGRGAFAKRAIATGTPIAISPVIHFDRSQMEIVEQKLYNENHWLPDHREHGIEYSDKVKGQQLLLNYCYGRPDSNVLLLPYAPVVNLINHSKEKANAYIRWSKFWDEPEYMKSQRPMELFSLPAKDDEETLMIEFVALRPIEPNEEIFLEYGDAWVSAWEKHVADWKSSKTDKNYVSAADWLRGDDPIRTTKSKPYPENLRSGCYFTPDDEMDVGEDIEWSDDDNNCLRPCDIMEGTEEDGKIIYSAIVFPMERFAEPDYCGSIPDEGVTVTGIPAEAVTVIDKPYSSDVHLSGAFRHEIGLPVNFFPDAWKAADPNPLGDFIPSPLAPGQLDQIRWSDTGEPLTENAHRLGLTSQVREVLLDYCDKMGIIDIFRHITVEDNGLIPGEDAYIQIKDYNWYLQRPESKWRSNLHWLSPSDDEAHEHFLQALSLAGFDDMLQGIGEYLGLDELAAFHLSFIAVSHSTQGFIHTDVQNTEDKTFNVIVPLILTNDSTPELDLQENDDGRLGRYGYEYDVAALMGDESFHGTSAVDYRMTKEMRLAATIYITEVTENNVQSIMDQYTQAYPPNDRDLLLSWAGRHWKRKDPSAKLPEPTQDHILLVSKTALK